MRQFPIILVPEAIQQVMALPTVSVSVPTSPKVPRLLHSPVPDPQPIRVGAIAIQAVAIALFA